MVRGTTSTPPRRIVAGALTTLTLALIAAPDQAGAARTLYVSDAGATGTGTLAQFGVAVPGGALAPLVPPTAAIGGEPQHVAVTSDGRFAYGTATEPGLLFAYRVGDDGALTEMGSVPAGVGAHGVSVTADGRFLYVGNQQPGTVTQYRVGPDGMPVPMDPPSVPSGAGASGVAISPDGRSVYVTNLNEFTVSQYSADPDTGALSPKTPATVPMPPAPSGLAVSPDGRSLYVATLTGRLAQFDIDPTTGALTPKTPATVRVGLGAAGVAITPDGRHLYTPNGLVNTVSQFSIDRRTGRLSALRPRAVRSGKRPGGIAMTPNGRALYTTAAGDGAVSWFSIGRDGRLGGAHRMPIAAGAGPHGVTVSPDQGPVARLRAPRRVRAGTAVRLDGSASTDSDGQVHRYRWSFGDGHHRTSKRATVRHRFHRPGPHVVRLRVIDDESCSNRLVYTGQSALCNGGPEAVVKRQITVLPPR